MDVDRHWNRESSEWLRVFETRRTHCQKHSSIPDRSGEVFSLDRRFHRRCFIIYIFLRVALHQCHARQALLSLAARTPSPTAVSLQVDEPDISRFFPGDLVFYSRGVPFTASFKRHKKSPSPIDRSDEEHIWPLPCGRHPCRCDLRGQSCNGLYSPGSVGIAVLEDRRLPPAIEAAFDSSDGRVAGEIFADSRYQPRVGTQALDGPGRIECTTARHDVHSYPVVSDMSRAKCEKLTAHGLVLHLRPATRKTWTLYQI